MKKQLMTVVRQNEIAQNIFELVVKGDLACEVKEPGQFVHIKVNEGADPLLRRPISICDVDKDKQLVTMIYRSGGHGTKQLSLKKEGQVIDVLGALGHGFPLEEAKKGDHALLVGGGIGVPPLYYLSKQLVENGVNVTHVLGFQTKDVVFYEEKFNELGPTYIATADGTHGTKGFVTDVISAQGLDQFDVLYSCGPMPMLKALEARFYDRNVYLSLEERMGCGIGACFACVCHTSEKKTDYKKICSDGPVFKVGEVLL